MVLFISKPALKFENKFHNPMKPMMGLAKISFFFKQLKSENPRNTSLFMLNKQYRNTLVAGKIKTIDFEPLYVLFVNKRLET